MAEAINEGSTNSPAILISLAINARELEIQFFFPLYLSSLEVFENHTKTNGGEEEMWMSKCDPYMCVRGKKERDY